MRHQLTTILGAFVLVAVFSALAFTSMVDSPVATAPTATPSTGTTTTADPESGGGAQPDEGAPSDEGILLGGEPDPLQGNVTNHFLCYRATLANNSVFDPVRVNLTDQFGTFSSVALGPQQLCNPASKNGEPVPAPFTHLACYDTKDDAPTFEEREVQVRDQFQEATWIVEHPRSLCNPAEKNGEQPVDFGFNHFRCYQANDTKPFPPITVTVKDQFGEGNAVAFGTDPSGSFLVTLCNPVSKDGGPLRDPGYHLSCYRIDPRFSFTPREVRVRDQFGLRTWFVLKPETLCLPASKGLPPPPGVEHFKCYAATLPKGARFTPRIVKLEDQFESVAAKVTRPTGLCNPASKNNEPVRDPFTHLVCYALQFVNARTFVPINVTVTNQFGKQSWTVVARDGLCVPSTKNREGPINPEVDHYKCYKATYQEGTRPSKIGLVRVDDQFEKRTVLVRNPDVLCNPVSKNNEPIPNKEAHLACYKILELPFPGIFPVRPPAFVPRTVYVENQLQKSDLFVRKPLSLCVPSTKELPPPPPPPPPPVLDHFKCYDAQLANGTLDPRTVSIADQFGNWTTVVTNVAELCTPVSKDGGPVSGSATHLACYGTRDVGTTFTPRDIQIVNQFGNLTLTLVQVAGLCNPAEKNGEQSVDFGFNHFRCYIARVANGTAPFTPRTVRMTDQFGNWTGVAEFPEVFCNPASKDGSSIRDPGYHLACYFVDQLPTFTKVVQVRDQFGNAQWKIVQDNNAAICVPSKKF